LELSEREAVTLETFRYGAAGYCGPQPLLVQSQPPFPHRKSVPSAKLRTRLSSGGMRFRLDYLYTQTHPHQHPILDTPRLAS
jgi:hypothetical protein